MKSKTPLIKKTIIFLISLLFFVSQTKAQKEVVAFNIDKDLYSYYQHCQANMMRPVVLNMADTLFQTAKSKSDVRMQAVALSLKLDYFYYKGNDENSIINHTNLVKKFAKETKQSKYYYFAWGNRLILYYLKTGRNNIALYEAEKMLKEAEADNDKIGLLHCYNSLAHIYSIKGFDKLAFDWNLKEIDLTETYHVENYNVAIAYIQVARYYIEHQKKEKALEMLKKADAVSNSPIHKASIKLYYINYYTTFDELDKAGTYLKECQELFKKDKRLDSLKKNLFRAEAQYYTKTNQYIKALEATNRQAKEEERLKEYALNSTQIRNKAKIFYHLGKVDSAYNCLQEYLTLEDSIKLENEQRATGEFATLLNVEKLKSEKKELVLQAQLKEINNKKTLIISLIGLLGLVFIFLYRENLLNRKLRLSERELLIKNDELTESREELQKAKDKAEASSKMKTTFIQSMSHEIRTPLNSIVGFSQILSDNYGEAHPETKEFAEIIKTNSNDLLRLITDVLTLSELDQSDEAPTMLPTNINDCCQIAIDLAKAHKKKNVELLFKPAIKNLVINSSTQYITQVLTNLLHNSAKFTTKGSITLEYAIVESTKEITFTITDTGIGIPLEKQEFIFERFYKINTFSQGTGLGLPICKSIADKLNGSLAISQNYTNGCQITFSIPY